MPQLENHVVASEGPITTGLAVPSLSRPQGLWVVGQLFIDLECGRPQAGKSNFASTRWGLPSSSSSSPCSCSQVVSAPCSRAGCTRSRNATQTHTSPLSRGPCRHIYSPVSPALSTDLSLFSSYVSEPGFLWGGHHCSVIELRSVRRGGKGLLISALSLCP